MKIVTRKIADTEITVHQCDTSRPGPRIAITSNLHGDECNGVVVIQQILERASSLLCGSLVLYPSLNPRGLRKTIRTLPPFDKDINRQFPGEIRGDELEQHVARIWKDLRAYELDLVIDLHTDSGEAYPYVLLDRCLYPNPALEEKLWILGEETGLFSIWEYPLHRYRQFQLQYSLAGMVLNEMKIPSLTMEVGPRRHIRASSVEITVKAIQNILVYLKMLNPSKRSNLGINRPYGIWRRETGPRVKQQGLIYPLANVGKRLTERTPIANIISEEGLIRERIFAVEPCVILAYPDTGYIQMGQAVCTLAVLE